MPKALLKSLTKFISTFPAITRDQVGLIFYVHTKLCRSIEVYLCVMGNTCQRDFILEIAELHCHAHHFQMNRKDRKHGFVVKRRLWFNSLLCYRFCATLSKLLRFSGPWFRVCYVGIYHTISLTSLAVCEDKYRKVWVLWYYNKISHISS